MINSHYGPHRSMDRPQSSTQAFRSLPCSKWDLPPQPSKTERTLRISKTLRYESKQPSSNLSKEAFHQSPLQSQSQRNASAATWSASRRRWHLRSGGLRATALVRLHVAGFAPPCRPAIRRVGRTGSWRKSTEGEGKGRTRLFWFQAQVGFGDVLGLGNIFRTSMVCTCMDLLSLSRKGSAVRWI